MLYQNQRSDQWTEKYAPSDIEEVAVHHGKIASVREWLETYTDPSNRQQDVSGGAILVLSGPAGSGKTTVLKMLAQEIDLTIVEWANSVNENNVVQRPVMPGEDSWRATSIDEEYIPVMRTFQEFFSRAQRFNPILTSRDLSQSSQSTGAQAGFSASMSASGRKNVILIEDLPPITAVSSRKIFQETIAKFANSRISSSSVLVLIVSDVFTKQSTELLFSNTNENRDPAMTIRVLLPSTVLDKIDSGGRGCARVKQIKFNPIAPTIMTKAIRKLINKEFKASHAHAPDTAEIEQAIKMHDGDIRAVINSLQFLITQGQDSSLGVFHAVAKVLYNRRDWKAPHVEFDSDIVKVPPQAWTMRRPPLPFNPDKDLIEKLPIEPDLYTLMLYQNYTRHMHTIEECHTAMEYLCIADRFSHSSGSSANYTQMIQMQPYMTSLAVRGLLFAPTSASPTSNVGGAKKHWWPELFAVNRIMHANDEMFLEVAVDLLGEEAKGLSAGHVTGPVREELVPMLHKCMRMNPYMPIFSKSLRPSSKAFVRDGAGNYGRKTGVIKKEFGEGDEGFLEDVTDTSPSAEAGVVDEIVDESMEKIGTGSGWDSRVKQDQQKKQRDQLTYEVEHDEDPIEDFSE
ncbi:Cell cycle checkpoint protein rad17 [Gamsiella multidivaricata]|nr:Cell cycle checkpoint protein rad17 [Gamsiella multidivaricata]